MTREIEELVRWCHAVAGLPIRRLAQDFEVPVTEIERIISVREPVYSPIPQRQKTLERNLERYRLALRAAYDA